MTQNNEELNLNGFEMGLFAGFTIGNSNKKDIVWTGHAMSDWDGHLLIDILKILYSTQR